MNNSSNSGNKYVNRLGVISQLILLPLDT